MIKAKIVSITPPTNGKGHSIVTIAFSDTSGEWRKEYKLAYTENLKLADFKQKLIEDLKRDYNKKTALTELEAVIGKEFNLT